MMYERLIYGNKNNPEVAGLREKRGLWDRVFVLADDGMDQWTAVKFVGPDARLDLKALKRIAATGTRWGPADSENLAVFIAPVPEARSDIVDALEVPSPGEFYRKPDRLLNFSDAYVGRSSAAQSRKSHQ